MDPLPVNAGILGNVHLMKQACIACMPTSLKLVSPKTFQERWALQTKQASQ